MTSTFQRPLAGLVTLVACALTSGSSEGIAASAVTAVMPSPIVMGAPLVLYTDLASGPNNGGEKNKGAYLSIFGRNFSSTGLGTLVKVYIGGVEVDNYRYLGPSMGRSDVQQITVQIGALGNPKRGQALPLKVVVNGVESNADQTFIVNPGRIYFVDNVNGNDSTGKPGDIARPYRYVQTADGVNGAGVWPDVEAGDIIVMRGRGVPWTDVGAENYFMRVVGKSGSKPTGAAGSGPIALMAYPTEDVFIRGTLAGRMADGCISAVNGENYPDAGKWATIAGLRLDCEGYDGPINTEIGGDFWRVVNNDLSASTAPTSGVAVPRMGGITGNGDGEFWVGNHIHDIQGSEEECHGIYIDGGGSYEIAYNVIERIRSGNGIQAFDNQGPRPTIDNVNIHHNLIRDVSKHGLNIADGSGSGWVVYNNVLYNTARAGIRFNTTDLKGARIFNNTFYNTNQTANRLYGALTNDWALTAGAVNVQNNIFVVASRTPYTSGSVGLSADAGTFRNNLWFNGSGSVIVEKAPLIADPQFVAVGSNFHLRSGSPAIGTGSTSVFPLVSNDFDLTKPRSGGSFDIGAYARP
jgi:hypothetical protein